MNRTALIILISAAALAGGYFFINSDTDIKAQAEKFGIIKKPTPLSVLPSHNSLFLVFDPSGSGLSTYSVPRISTEFINSAINAIIKQGAGEIWVSSVDMDGNNNEVLYLKISKAPEMPEYPVRGQGESTIRFNKRIEKFKTDSLNAVKEIEQYNMTFNQSKDKFLAECEKLIKAEYKPKPKTIDYSDCIGALNTAIRSLNTVSNDSTHFRSIMFISDGVQDLPKGVSSKKLNVIPDDISIVTVNHSGSKNNVIANRCIESDNLDRALETIIRSHKPANQ